MEWKNEQRGRLSVFSTQHKLQFLTGQRPWGVPADIALPFATQNELDDHDARQLVANKVKCVAEGANMPSTLEAVDVFLESGVLYAPGKASRPEARRGGKECVSKWRTRGSPYTSTIIRFATARRSLCMNS